MHCLHLHWAFTDGPSLSKPVFLNDTISAISKCTTPVSMFVIGSILADAPVESLFSKNCPLLHLLAAACFSRTGFTWSCSRSEWHSLFVNICVLMTGMPAGSTVSILADQYNADAAFASQLVFTSTLFSIFTIPLLTLIM